MIKAGEWAAHGRAVLPSYWAVLCAGCVAAAPPPAPSVPPPAIVAAPVAPAAPAPPPATPVVVPRAADAAPETPLVPLIEGLPRVFEAVPLPRGTTGLRAVDGRAEGDVWILGAGQEVLHWDGSRVVPAATPSCTGYEQKQVWVEGGGIRLVRVRTATVFEVLDVLGQSVRVAGYRGLPAQTPAFVEARSEGRRAWRCVDRSEWPTTRRVWAGGAEIAISNGTSGLSIDGRPAPSIEMRSFFPPKIAARSPADVWQWDADGSPEVARFDGVTWEPRPVDLFRVDDLWLDETGAAWVLGKDAGKKTAVVRWDFASRAWQRLPFPAELDATLVRGASARDVWFFGAATGTHWDGRELRRAALPVGTIAAAWVSARGDVWVVGQDAHERVRGLVVNEDGERVPGLVPAGVVLRALAPEGGSR